jgi:AcrR family transcriptional regulator
LDRKTILVENIKHMQTKEELIREEVISTAQRLFQKYGFAKTTMEDIAKASGRGKSTLYYYYKSKDEIFEAVLLKEANEAVSAVLEATKKETSAGMKLRVYFKNSFQIIRSKINLYEVMRDELINTNAGPLCQKAINNSIKEFNTREKQVVKEILSLGIKNNEFTADVNDNIDLTVYVIITGLRTIAINLAFDEKELYSYIQEDKIDVMINILFKGIEKQR